MYVGLTYDCSLKAGNADQMKDYNHPTTIRHNITYRKFRIFRHFRPKPAKLVCRYWDAEIIGYKEETRPLNYESTVLKGHKFLSTESSQLDSWTFLHLRKRWVFSLFESFSLYQEGKIHLVYIPKNSFSLASPVGTGYQSRYKWLNLSVGQN